jgi:hypothetical protein
MGMPGTGSGNVWGAGGVGVEYFWEEADGRGVGVIVFTAFVTSWFVKVNKSIDKKNEA